MLLRNSQLSIMPELTNLLLQWEQKTMEGFFEGNHRQGTIESAFKPGPVMRLKRLDQIRHQAIGRGRVNRHQD